MLAGQATSEIAEGGGGVFGRQPFDVAALVGGAPPHSSGVQAKIGLGLGVGLRLIFEG